MPGSRRIVCGLPGMQHYRSEESSSVKAGRISCFVGGLLLFITAILALCKVGSFSRLGEKFGWSGASIGFLIAVVFGSTKYLKQESPAFVEQELTLDPASKQREKSASSRSSAKVKKNTIDCGEEIIYSTHLSEGMVIIQTDKSTTLRTLEGEIVTNIHVAGSFKMRFLAREKEKIVLFDHEKHHLIFGVIDASKKFNIVRRVEHHVEPHAHIPVAISGDKVVVGSGQNVHLYEWNKGTNTSFTCSGAVGDLRIDQEKLLVVVEESVSKQNLLSFALGDLSAPCITKKALSFYLIDTDRFICRTDDSDKGMLYSLSTEKPLAPAGSNVGQILFYKELRIVHVKENENELGERIAFQGHFIKIYSKEGAIVKEWQLEADEFDRIDIEMVDNELVVYIHKCNEFSKLFISKYLITQ